MMALDTKISTASRWATAFALVASVAANASAQAQQVELTCHTTPEAIATAQNHIVKTAGMIPVVSRFINVGTDNNAQWAMGTVMMHPESKKGVEWARMPQGHVCVTKSYSNIQLFNNASFDPKAFLDPKSFPRADDRGNGVDISTSGANATLITSSKIDKQNPMYRANVDAIINLTGKPLNTPTKYVEYLVGNPTTKEGILFGVNLNGRMISGYFRIVGNPATDGVRFGAIYSPAAEDMLGIKSAVAMLSPERK